jgi:hypothetical protein
MKCKLFFKVLVSVNRELAKVGMLFDRFNSTISRDCLQASWRWHLQFDSRGGIGRLGKTSILCKTPILQLLQIEGFGCFHEDLLHIVILRNPERGGVRIFAVDVAKR